MSKVTPSALRGLSVAVGTVGLAAVGAAAMAGQARAAESGVPGPDDGGLPVSSNASPAPAGAAAQNHGVIAGIPLSDFPLLGQLPDMLDNASPSPDALASAGHAEGGELPVTRSRLAGPRHGSYVPRHAAVHAAPAIHAAPVPAAPAPAPAAPAPAPAAAAPRQAPAFVPTELPPAQAAAAQSGPLDNVTNALRGLPVADRLASPGLPLSGISKLTGGLSSLRV